MTEFTLDEAKDLTREANHDRLPAIGEKKLFWTTRSMEGITFYWLAHNENGYVIETTFNKSIRV